VRRWPDLPVYVHEVGAPHMADPERLVKSATRLYGEEGMQRLWGDVVPVPEENLRVLSGGERGVEGAFTVEYTPGHASHHVSYLHESEGWAYVGDVGGVRIPPSDLVLAPTPPPDVDVEAWDRSLDLEPGRPARGLPRGAPHRGRRGGRLRGGRLHRPHGRQDPRGGAGGGRAARPGRALRPHLEGPHALAFQARWVGSHV